MRLILVWFARGGIAAALAALLLSAWPSNVVVQSQLFEFNAADKVQARIQFGAPEKMIRGAQTDFFVLLDLNQEPKVDGTVHPVMIYRLELEGAQIVPDAVFQIPLTGVQHQQAGWRVRLPQAGDYDGTWWVYVEYVGQGGEVIDRQALFARRFTVESRGILGMSVTGVRWVSMVVMGLGLGVEIWNNLFRKSSQKA